MTHESWLFGKDDDTGIFAIYDDDADTYDIVFRYEGQEVPPTASMVRDVIEHG